MEIGMGIGLGKRLVVAVFVVASACIGRAGTLEFGDEDLLNTGSYGSDPKAGATLLGLAPNVVSTATNAFGPHGFPFAPAAGDFAGTDQIFVGAAQTAIHDGYSEAPQRLSGPLVATLDYSALVPSGTTVGTFTLGIAADDFQFPDFGQPFTATINGITDAALTSELNSLSLNGPLTHFFTIGIDPSLLVGSHILTLSISEGGDGGDGFAADFFTAGVTANAASTVPLPSAFYGGVILLGVCAGWGLLARRGAVGGR
jgi:hypothetical protein